MSTGKSIGLWVLAVVLMASLAVYQRITGPTYPIKGSVKISGKEVEYNLPRSHGGDSDAPVELKVKEDGVHGSIKYKRYKSYDEWSTEPLKKEGNMLTFDLPNQPPAGKIIYEVFLRDGNKKVNLSEGPVIIRFKGEVPKYFLYPHIFFMFLAMCFSMRTGFEVLFGGNKVWLLTLLTTILLFIGGIILGPVIQLYAFGELWAGWPLGHDLTDNKTIVAFIMWIAALLVIRKKPEKKIWALTASVVLLAVYLIPHSVLGSEIDYRELEDKKELSTIYSKTQYEKIFNQENHTLHSPGFDYREL